MTYYHATHRDRLPSILEHGLGWAGAAQNWDCKRGVYLAEEPGLAVLLMVESYLHTAPEDMTPAEALGEIAIICLDDSRVPRIQLGPDPGIPLDGVWLYRGVIDARNMPVLTIDEIMAGY